MSTHTTITMLDAKARSIALGSVWPFVRTAMGAAVDRGSVLRCSP